MFGFQTHKVPKNPNRSVRTSDISQLCLKSEQKLWISDTFLPKLCVENQTFVQIKENAWNLNCLETEQLLSVWNP